MAIDRYISDICGKGVTFPVTSLENALHETNRHAINVDFLLHGLSIDTIPRI